MELDEDSLDGNWSTNSKTGMDFFIINDAIFSKLCILGDDVEPCFEGASVTAPEVSTSFTKVDDTFKKTLYTMMQELKFALEGGQNNMDNDKENIEEEVVNNEKELTNETPIIENQDSTEAQSAQDTFAKNEDDEEEDVTKNACGGGSSKKEKTKHAEDDSEEDDKKEKNDDKEEEEEDDESKKYSLLAEENESLKIQYAELNEKYEALVQFKQEIENKQKDELIKSFYMLSDEDKADVIANKANYSLEDIEAKLSIICVRKKVNFDLDNSSKNNNTVEDKEVTTYTLENTESSVPAWVTALKNTQKSREN